MLRNAPNSSRIRSITYIKGARKDLLTANEAAWSLALVLVNAPLSR